MSQRNLIAQNPKGNFINLKVGHDGHIETNHMKTAFGEATTAQLTPVLQEIFPYTINTRVWTKIETKASASFVNNMVELKTTADITSDVSIVSKKRMKYRTGMGVMCRFTALWETDEENKYSAWIGIGDKEILNGFYFLKNNELGMCIVQVVNGYPSVWYQAYWDDPCDGTGSMPALNWSKGNVFQIQFQYLGFGNIKFSIENPDTGEFQLVHMIKYANAYTQPSLGNTTLPFSARVYNNGGSGIQILKTASCSMFIEGANTINTTITNTIEADKKTNTNETPVLSIRNKTLFNNTLTNYSNVYPSLISITNEDTKANIVKIILNGTLTNAAFADVDAKTSIVDTDTAATAIANGTTLLKFYVNPSSTQQINLRTYDIQLTPSDVLTFTQKAVSGNGGINFSVIANYIEDH